MKRGKIFLKRYQTKDNAILYAVVRTIDTFRYEVGENLTPKQVENLIMLQRFTVTID